MVKKAPGIAFGDYISKGDFTKRNFDYEGKKNSPRDFLLPVLAAIFFLVLFTRLFFLQVVNGQYYRNLSNDNKTKTVTIFAPRGIIFDRNNEPLVFNIPGFRETKDGETVFILNEKALEQIAKGNTNLEVDSLRQYPHEEAFSHVLGYVGQVSGEELKYPQFSNYNISDIIGKEGLEKTYEEVLKGRNGRQLFEADANGELIRKLGEDEPVSGQNINTTLDVRLQKAVFDAMKGVEKGAAIVSTPKGEILALVSRPSFDPNLFTLGGEYKPSTESAYSSVSDVFSDSQKQPLLNRAISGTYPPGSTFKLVVAASGLSNDIIDGSFTVEDTGILRVGDFSFANWYYTDYGGKDGNVDVIKGIKRSNDIFFYKLAEKIGVTKISETAGEFGVGKKLGIDLPGEVLGNLPTPSWKERAIGEPWYLGDTYHYGIGQGYLLTTPLQVNAWTQAVANSGTLFKPHLLKDSKPYVLENNLLDTKSTNLIRQGMIESCEPGGGVAYPLFEFKVQNPSLGVDGRNILDVNSGSVSAGLRQISIACKTGTSEHGIPGAKPHAWITLFAPSYNPEIIVTILSEVSGQGSEIAAPIAKEILEAYFGE